MSNRHRAVSMAFNGNWSRDEEQKTQKSLSDLKSLYKDIRYDWPQLVQGDITPIELAIAFLDDTSVGLAHRKSEFDDLCEATSDALRAAVVENHETFNNSVGLYHLLTSIAKESQEDSLQIKELLESSTRDVQDRTHVLKDLDNSSAKYSEIIEVLDAMEHLREIPSRIDKLIVNKKIHEVYDVIADGYKTAAKYNLWSLSAMNSTQSYLEMQSNNLYDMIVDELNNEIYLKNITFQTQNKESWSSLILFNSPQITSFRTLLTQLTNLELYIYNSANLDIAEIAECFTEPTETFLHSQLPKLHAHHSKHEEAKVDYSLILEHALSPATESFFYIYMLLITASKLNRLQPVLEILVSSVQLELHELINRTTEECKLKNLQQIARIAKIKTLETTNPYDKISGQTFNDASVPILQDLFGSIFIKALVVLQKHKVISEIVKLIEASQSVSQSKRDSTFGTTAPAYEFKTIWGLLKKELDSMIVNYIHVEDLQHLLNIKTDHNPSANKLHQVLTKKHLFQFDDVSYDSTSKTSEDMKMILDEMFPGFLLGSKKTGDVNEVSPFITSERFSALVEVLVPKNIFNMRIILEFFLIFTAGSHRIFTDFEREKGTSLLSYQFFYDFMKNTFMQKLKDEIDMSFQACMTGELANSSTDRSPHEIRFNQATVSLSDEDISGRKNHARSISSGHVYANAVQFRRLFTHACHTMNTSFTYRKDVTDMVLHLLKRFASSYDDYFKELLSGGGSHDLTKLRLGLTDSGRHVLQTNKWMRAPALLEMSGGVLQFHDRPTEVAELLEKEMELMFYRSSSPDAIFDISKDDLLDDEWFNQVCILLLTSSWVLSWLPQMRKELNYTIYDANGDSSKVTKIERLKHDWSFLENGRSTLAMSEKTQHVYLTLNLEKVGEFDDVVQMFESFRDKTLIALRYDLRLKGLYYIGKSYQDQLVLPTEPADSDQFISLFNKEVYSIGTKTHDMLSSAECDCIFIGLPAFLTKALLQGSELVKVANRNGVKKMLLNIFTLQQMLRSIMRQHNTVDFSKASRYFELFTESEHVFLQKITANKEGYSRSEALNLLRLMYSEKLEAPSASSFNQTKYKELSRKINDIFS